MPRRRKSHPTPNSDGPVHISEAAEQLRAEIPSLKTAAQLSARPDLSPDFPDFEPTAPRYKS